MQNRIATWLQAKAPFLFKDNMPVWLTILASIIAAVSAAFGTYLIAPAINRQYQIDEARSVHVSKTTQDLNAEIITLSQKIRRLNDALVNETGEVASIRQDCLDQITKLQWMLVDLNVILKSEDDKNSVRRLSNSIDKVKNALDNSVDADAEPILLNAMRDLGNETRDVLDRLYVAAALK